MEFEYLATEIQENFCQPQPQPGEMRLCPSDESQSATKKLHLEEGYNYEDLKKLL